MVKEVTEVVKEVSEGSHKKTGTEFMTDPTPDEIQQRCAEIQQTWTEAQRLSRLRADLRPMVTLADGRPHDIDSETYNDHHDTREKLQAAADA